MDLTKAFDTITAWKVWKVFSGPYFPVFGPKKTPYLDTFDAVINQELIFAKFHPYGFSTIWESNAVRL